MKSHHAVVIRDLLNVERKPTGSPRSKVLDCIWVIPGLSDDRVNRYQHWYSWFPYVLPGECWNSTLKQVTSLHLQSINFPCAQASSHLIWHQIIPAADTTLLNKLKFAPLPMHHTKTHYHNNKINMNIVDFCFTCCFYECETWSLTSREEHRSKVFENKVLRRIFEPK
jgi:hypothetical protein